METKLKEIYEDPNDPGSLGGVNRLLASARAHGLRVTRPQVQNFLKSHNTYTLHKPVRHHFKRNPTIVGGIDRQWQADLADLSEIGKSNGGYRYLLTIVDCFSKYAWAIPLKNKEGKTVLAAFRKVFEDRKPEKIQTDKGKEFLNKDLQNFLKKEGVHHFVTQNETKAAMVERFNRTLKTRMWTYFTNHNTRQYLDVLPRLLHSYNHSVHRTIGMKPADVQQKHEKQLFRRMYGRSPATTRAPRAGLERDAVVRISKAKTIFEKGYLPNWTGEVFKVSDSVSRQPKRVYKLKDMLGEDIKGTFYPEEIQQITYDKDKPVPIEKILKTRTVRGKKEHLVKWLHLPKKFNSWVKDKDLHRYDGD